MDSRFLPVFHLRNEGRTVFSQLLDFLPQYEFDKCVTFPREGGQRAENLRKKNRHAHEYKTEPNPAGS